MVKMANGKEVVFESANNGHIEFPEDCERIRAILSEHGVEADLVECDTLWSMFSYELDASYLTLPLEDEEVWYHICEYVGGKKDWTQIVRPCYGGIIESDIETFYREK